MIISFTLDRFLGGWIDDHIPSEAELSIFSYYVPVLVTHRWPRVAVSKTL